MITGGFDPSGRPTVEGYLTLPRFGILDRAIVFRVDTGADATSIHPRDSRFIGIPFDRLRRPIDSNSVGGVAKYFREAAILEFIDGEARTIRKHKVEVLIAKPHPNPMHSINQFHSLLGRDIIDRWRMLYDQTDNLLEFTFKRP